MIGDKSEIRDLMRRLERAEVQLRELLESGQSMTQIGRAHV